MLSMSKKKYNRWERFYNQLSLVFHGVIAVSLIPFGWAFLETQRESPDPPMVEGALFSTIKWVFILLSLGVMISSFFYSRNLGFQSDQEEEIDELLKVYKHKKLVDYAILETASLVAFLGLLITKDQLFSFLYVAVLFMFSFKRPTYDRVTNELGLSDDEVKDWIEKE